MTDLKLQCRCGKVRGQVEDFSPRRSTRTVCHCGDCQAYAHHFPDDSNILDEFGGSDILQLTPAQVTISDGMDHLRCLRLTPNGFV